MAPTMEVTVLLPFEPVMPMIGAWASAAKTSMSLDTGRPRRRASASSGRPRSTPGETTICVTPAGTAAGMSPAITPASGIARRIASRPGGAARVSANHAVTPRAAKCRAQDAPVAPMPSTSSSRREVAATVWVTSGGADLRMAII